MVVRTALGTGGSGWAPRGRETDDPEDRFRHRTVEQPLAKQAARGTFDSATSPKGDHTPGQLPLHRWSPPCQDRKSINWSR